MLDISDIFLREYAFVLRGLLRLGVQQADVRDVAQEVFLEVATEIDRLDVERPLRPWLYAFMARFAANYRRLARHREIPMGDTRAQATGAQEDHGQTRDLLLRALARVDFEQRTCVVMHDFEGFTAQEIANAMATPLGTVYSRVRMGRDAFRRALAILEEDHG